MVLLRLPPGWALSYLSISAALAFSDAFPHYNTYPIHCSNSGGDGRNNIKSPLFFLRNNGIARRHRSIESFISSGDDDVAVADAPNPFFEYTGDMTLKRPDSRTLVAPKFDTSNHLSSSPSESFFNSNISIKRTCRKRVITSPMRNFLCKILKRVDFMKSKLHDNIQLHVKKIFLALSLLLISITAAPFAAHASSSRTSSATYSASSPDGVPSSTPPKRKLISLHAQSPQSYTHKCTPTKRKTRVIRRNYPKSKRHLKASKRLATLFVGGSIIASSFRSPDGDNGSNIISIGSSSATPSRRRNRRIRNTTPFGIIRNLSPLGNGVSVIRVRLALEFSDENSNGNNGEGLHVNDFFAELNDEKQLLETDIMKMMPSIPRETQGSFRKKVMGNYLSNVATLLCQYQPFIKYGSIDSVRVPFAEEALREFQEIKDEERNSYALMKETRSDGDERDSMKTQLTVLATEEGRKLDDGLTKSKFNSDRYVMTTILLAIKGDHTTIPLPLGLSQRREMGRALKRIAEDARVEDCLVGSEIFCFPNKIYNDGGKGDGILLSGARILDTFPDMSRLS